MSSVWSRLVAVGLLAVTVVLPALAVPKPGSVAPEFTGSTVDGKPFESTRHKGKVLLLNFFDCY